MDNELINLIKQRDAKSFEYFQRLWKSLNNAMDQNDTKTINKRTQEICDILPFKDINEKNEYLSLTSSFKFWEDYEEKTLLIAKRLKGVFSLLCGIKELLYDDLSEISYDFYCDYFNFCCDSYIDDMQHEFCDSRTSVYYCDQKAYFNAHTEWCEQCLIDFYDKDTICEIILNEGLESLICKCGAVGEYEEYYHTISMELDDMFMMYIADYLINLGYNEPIEEQELFDIISEIKNKPISRLSEVLDYIKEALNLGE